MIVSIAAAVGSIVARQAASIALSKTADWMASRKLAKEAEAGIEKEITVNEVVQNMDRIMEWSHE